MRKYVWRLLSLIVFGWFYINATSYTDNTIGYFVTKAVTATEDDKWQCGPEEITKAINITCPPYRAVPDDNMDDSKAFQAAVDALPPSGGAVVIPSGTYLFDNPLVIHKSVHLLGAGPTTILTHSKDLNTNGAANFIRIGGVPIVTEDVTISDLTLQGPQRKNLRTAMIRIVDNVKGVKLRNLSFRHVSSTCILIFGTNIQNVDISDNRADEFYEQFVELASGGISSVRIERNVAKSTRGHPKLGPTEPFGIMFEPKITGEITDVSIVGNQISFEGMSKTECINTGGISLSTGLPSTPFLYRHILIQDNIFSTLGVGVRVQTLRAGSVSGPGSVVITRNRIEGATNYGIRVNPASDDAHRDTVSITENTVRGYSAQAYNLYDGIRLDGSAINPEIRSNQILSLTDGEAGHGRYGINIGPGIKNAVIRDNKLGGYRVGAIFNKSLVETVDK